MDNAPVGESARHRDGLTGVQMKWFVFLFGALVLLVLFPQTYRSWRVLFILIYLPVYQLYTLYVVSKPGLPGWLWHVSLLVDLSYISTLVYLGHGFDTLTLLYPLAMIGVAIDRPNFRDFLLAGLLGHVSYLVTLYLLYRSFTFYLTGHFWVSSLSIGAIFFLTLLVVRILVREKTRLADLAAELEASNRRLENMAVRDDLTGLPNQRYFFGSLDRYLQLARESNQPLTLLLIDIDYLKLYNKTHGYHKGDQALQALAEILKQKVSSRDLVCRMDGDQFAVLLAKVPPDDARAFMSRVRAAFAEVPLEGKEYQPLGTMTVSAGLATYPLHAASAEELFNRAEDALNKAKQRERSGTEIYHSLLEEFRQSPDLSSNLLVNTVQTLLTVINAKDRYTYGHSERVMRYSSLVAEQMGLDRESIRVLKYAAFLHDIGKIEISRDILLKEGPLLPDERNIIKLHTLFGVNILEPLRDLRELLPIVRHHHERYDGEGYPDGLGGEDIPIGARILAVADSFDAMRSNRPYRRALSFERTMAELQRGAGTQFDPGVVAAFRAAARKIREAEEGLRNHRHYQEAAASLA